MPDRPRRFDKSRPDPIDAEPLLAEAPPTADPDHMVLVGRVLAPWGLRGQLRVYPETANPERFRRGAWLFVDGTPRRVETSRTHQRGHVVLRFEGVSTPEAADEFRGAELTVPEADAQPLGEDWYYHFQLLGLTVVTDDGRELGVLAQVLETGANDVYIVRRDGREVLIPAIADVVIEVDLASKRMVVHPLPGLLDEDAG